MDTASRIVGLAAAAAVIVALALGCGTEPTTRAPDTRDDRRDAAVVAARDYLRRTYPNDTLLESEEVTLGNSTAVVRLGHQPPHAERTWTSFVLLHGTFEPGRWIGDEHWTLAPPAGG